MTNDAAERLRRLLVQIDRLGVSVVWFDEALAAERRATVAAIRDILGRNHHLHGAEFYRLEQIEAMLDEAEAER